MSTIFVQIAAYDDDELPKTINDCINKSSGNHEIFFGVHECYINNKTIIDLKNVKIKYSKAPENLGIGMGRYLANQFYNNEDYYLQIDCHSRFIENWDQLLINNLEKYLSIGNKCILTGYPPGYWYEGKKEYLDLSSKGTMIKIKKDISQHKTFYSSRFIDQEAKELDGTFCSESTSGGFLFGSGDISKAKLHPGIQTNDEFYKAAVLYTYGYNLMNPDKPVIFHLYGNNSKRVHPAKSYPLEYALGVERSNEIIKRILSKSNYHDPESKIWLGQERSLEIFGRYLGIDFKNGIIEEEV